MYTKLVNGDIDHILEVIFGQYFIHFIVILKKRLNFKFIIVLFIRYLFLNHTESIQIDIAL